MASKHQVTAPLVIARTKEGPRIYLYQGAVVPDNVSGEEVERLVEAGLVAEEDKALRAQLSQAPSSTNLGAVPAGLDTPPRTVPAGGDGDGPPAKSASKAEWVDYAAAQGADRGEAEQLTKDQLVEQYGS